MQERHYFGKIILSHNSKTKKRKLQSPASIMTSASGVSALESTAYNVLKSVSKRWKEGRAGRRMGQRDRLLRQELL